MGVGLHICLDNMVLSSMCLGLFRTTKLCLSSDSVGVGLQMHLDNNVVSRMCLNSICCLSCACQVTVLELVCKHILIIPFIRLRQVAFEVVQHNCAFCKLHNLCL